MAPTQRLAVAYTVLKLVFSVLFACSLRLLHSLCERNGRFAAACIDLCHLRMTLGGKLDVGTMSCGVGWCKIWLTGKACIRIHLQLVMMFLWKWY